MTCVCGEIFEAPSAAEVGEEHFHCPSCDSYYDYLISREPQFRVNKKQATVLQKYKSEWVESSTPTRSHA
jgi:hypothetical protein